MIKFIKIIFLWLFLSPSIFAATYYIAPAGNDAGDGSTGSPWKTFNKATDSMSSGDTLILKNGTYTHADNGGIDSTTGGGADCDLPPSGTSGHYTIIRGETAGSVFVEHTLQLGSAAESVDWVEVYDITFKSTTPEEDRWGGMAIYNGDNNYIHDCGFYRETLSNGDVVQIGTNDINDSAQYNLIEDCWIWGHERVGLIIYNTQYNTLRRILIITDGSSYSSGNPAVGMTVYSSRHNYVENVIVMDRELHEAVAGADIALTQADPAGLSGDNYYLGCMSINSPYNGANFYSNAYIEGYPIFTVENFVSFNASNLGFQQQYDTYNTGSYIINHLTIYSNNSGTGLRMDDFHDIEVKNSVLEYTNGRAIYSINGSSGVLNIHHNQGYQSGITPWINDEGTGDNNSYPVDSQMLYLLTPGAGAETGDDTKKKGAEILYRYGIDGTKFGDDGADALTATPIWPWPNEARIKTEICNEVSRSFCTYEGLDETHDTLTAYIWELLGNEIPADIYTDETAPTAVSASILADGTHVRLNTSEAVQFGAGGTGGGAMTGCSGGATTLGTPSVNGSYVEWTITSRTVYKDETSCVLAYTQPTDGLQDTSENDMATFDDLAVATTNAPALSTGTPTASMSNSNGTSSAVNTNGSTSFTNNL